MKTAELMKTTMMHQKMIPNKQGFQIKSYPRYEMKYSVNDLIRLSSLKKKFRLLYTYK